MKLPEKITREREAKEGTCFLTRKTVNSIIDYLAERKGTVWIEAEQKPIKEERSCNNCGALNDGKCVVTYDKCICVLSANPYCYWTPKEQPKEICHICGASKDNQGLIYHSDTCPEKPTFVKETWQEKLDKAIEYNRKGYGEGFEFSVYSQYLKKACCAMQDRIKELEKELKVEKEYSENHDKEIDNQDKEIERLKDGIKEFAKEYRRNINKGKLLDDLEELIKED